MSAYHIAEVLKKLTKEGICVICTLHQPSSQIWTMIDKVLLLSYGYTCYFGNPGGAQAFFESTGKALPVANFNPADFYIFQINSDFDSTINPAKINESFLAWDSKSEVIPTNEEIRESRQAEQPISIAIENYTGGAEIHSLPGGAKRRANGFEKCLSLCKRNLFNTVMNPGIIGVRLLMYIILTFIIGFIYFDLGNSFSQQDIVSRTSLLFYVDAFLVFMSIAVLPFFMMERSIVNKEVKNKLYRPLYYQFARFVTAIPGVALIAILSTILVVLPSDINGFGVFFAILLLSLIIAESLAMLVSLIVPHYIIGMALIAGLYGVFMLCQGFLIVKSDIPGYFIWIYYIAFHTYSFEAFMHNEFSDIQSFDSPQFTTGEEVLEFYSMQNVKIWKDVVILICYFIILEIFTAIVMAIMFRTKRIKWKEVNDGVRTGAGRTEIQNA